jgi:hypothetical protein
MDRPLWQILLSLLIAGLALQRGAALLALHAAGGGVEGAALGLFAVQGAAALLAALGIFLGSAWAIAALVALGGVLVASTALEAFWLGIRSPIGAVSTMLIVALSTAALALVLRHEFSSPADERG